MKAPASARASSVHVERWAVLIPWSLVAGRCRAAYKTIRAYLNPIRRAGPNPDILCLNKCDALSGG